MSVNHKKTQQNVQIWKRERRERPNSKRKKKKIGLEVFY